MIVQIECSSVSKYLVRKSACIGTWRMDAVSITLPGRRADKQMALSFCWILELVVLEGWSVESDRWSSKRTRFEREAVANARVSVTDTLRSAVTCRISLLTAVGRTQVTFAKRVEMLAVSRYYVNYVEPSLRRPLATMLSTKVLFITLSDEFRGHSTRAKSSNSKTRPKIYSDPRISSSFAFIFSLIPFSMGSRSIMATGMAPYMPWLRPTTLLCRNTSSA